jgi:hypothetical protein
MPVVDAILPLRRRWSENGMRGWKNPFPTLPIRGRESVGIPGVRMVFTLSS